MPTDRLATPPLARGALAQDTGCWHWDVSAGLIHGDLVTIGLFGVETVQAGTGHSEARYLRAVDSGDQGRLRTAFDRYRRQAGPISERIRVSARDGAAQWLHISARCVPDEAGRPARYLGIVTPLAPAGSEPQADLDHLADLLLAARAEAAYSGEAFIMSIVDLALLQLIQESSLH